MIICSKLLHVLGFGPNSIDESTDKLFHHEEIQTWVLMLLPKKVDDG